MPEIVEYRVPGAKAGLYHLTAGKDGGIWAGDRDGGDIVRFDPATGLFERFANPNPRGAPMSLVPDSDGTIWFSQTSGGTIARINPSGAIEEFPLPFERAMVGGLAPADDGAVFLTEWTRGLSFLLHPSDGYREVGALPVGSKPLQPVRAGQDFWVSDPEQNRLLRLSLSGEAEIFPSPKPGSDPRAIALGPDGRLWVVMTGGAALMAVDRTTGAMTEFPLPAEASARFACPTSDGVWFTDEGRNRICHMDGAGNLTIEHPVPSAGAGLRAMILHGTALYFAEYDTGCLGCLALG